MIIFAEKEFNLGKSSILSEQMFCVCGFSTHSGNKMAKHLGTHGCKSAYPSQEEAFKAKVEKGGKKPDGLDKADFANKEENPSDMEKEDEENIQKRDDATTKDLESGEVGTEKESKPEGNLDKKMEKNAEKSPTECTDTDENEKEAIDERPPGPGGLLFGTFFNYMGEDQSNGDKANTEKKSEDSGSAEGAGAKNCEEDTKEMSDERMDTE